MNDLVEFLKACLDEDALWAREASRRNEHPVPDGGVHWKWECTGHDMLVEPDPGSGDYLCTELDCNVFSLRSVEEFPEGNWMLPQFALSRVDDVPSSVAGHILRHDPAHVLREVAAKRRILARYERHIANCETRSPEDHDTLKAQVGYYALRDLAAAYEDRPGYKDEWRP